ncbi:MAG TPA: hypothetical protein VHX59_22365 [Mycobacteriales bacterium]|jgi:hypothetical protein|nr:hypothetical protein [Mycobacteriales bacterium]
MSAPDAILHELLAARDHEVAERAMTRQANERDIATRADRNIERAMGALGDMATTVQSLDDEFGKHGAKDARKVVTEAKARLAEAPDAKGMLRVADRASVVFSAALYASLQPYYVRLYNSNGSVYYSGYNPGAVDLWDDAKGSGNGWFGSGAASIDVLADWWFYFNPREDRSYSYTISCPLHGYFICHADDGFWDSKEAHVRLDVSAMGYQYNAKPTTSVNIFDYDGQNINLNNRYDNAPVFYYSDLLGADTAYLRVTESLYGYARGDGSHAEVNFSDGNANYIGPPTVYVS